MIGPDAFSVDPWLVCERELQFDKLAETESIFALSNGHIGLRANLDEGEPAGSPGTFLNSFYEVRPLPYAESSYGNPEAGQTIVNVTNGKVFRLLVDDEPFDVRYGKLIHHERTLDLREGVLRREAEWISPAGKAVHVRSTRVVSFVQRSIAAITYEVEAAGDALRIGVQSELVANEPVAPWGASPTTLARRRRCSCRWWPRTTTSMSCGSPSCTARARAGCASPPAWITSSRDPTARSPLGRVARTWSAHGEHRAEARREAADRQVPLLRLVEPALAALAPAIRSTLPWHPPAAPVGTTC